MRMSNDPEAPTTVVSLSRVALSEVEANLLSKRHSFCPTPRHKKKEEIPDNLEKFFRRLPLKEFFLEEKEEENDAQTLVCLPSAWIPPKRREVALETSNNKLGLAWNNILESSLSEAFH